MKPLKNWRSRLLNRSGQALIEFAFVSIMLLLLIFGLIDFCRAISIRQVITNLTREGSNLASRNTSLPDTMTAIIASANPLNITNNGRIIISVVVLSNNVPTVIDQLSQGSITNQAASKIGTKGGEASMPSTNPHLPEANQTVYVTEVYYSFTPITPVGKLLGVNLPTRLYDVAYF
jgi:Flp pilus assembly protein TadG